MRETMLNTNAIYLASKSPRRQELLKLLGVSFEPLIVETPEIIQAGESAKDYSIPKPAHYAKSELR